MEMGFSALLFVLQLAVSSPTLWSLSQVNLFMLSYEPHIMVTHLFWAEENTTKTSRAESLENRVSRTIESRKRKKKRYWGQ
ncbi:hypothetical protein [Methanothrix sp.]